MQILDHTDEHQPTFMRDVYSALVGEQVFVYINGNSFAGELVSYNGAILHVLGHNKINYYFFQENVIAIGSNK